MSENKFDKEKIEVVNENETPRFFWDNEKVYNIKGANQVWWQCPKCGDNITFDSIVEEFDYASDEKQFITLYSWNCESCGAEGNVYAAVNPLYISIIQNDEENKD